MESYLPLGVMRVGSLVTALESVICFLRIGFVLIKHVSICSFINPANENVWKCLICWSVVGIPKSYTVISTGITGTRYPQLLGTYKLKATSYSGMRAIIYQHGAFYLVKSSAGWMVGKETGGILRRLGLNRNKTEAAPERGWNFRADGKWTEDTSVFVYISLGKL